MTLHTLSLALSKAAKYGVIAVVTIVSLVMMYRIGLVVKQLLFPPPPELPTRAFGKLPQIVFGRSFYRESFTYTLNTLTGELPQLPDRANIYKIERTPPTLLNADNADKKVWAIGFKENEEFIPHEALTPTLFRWEATTFQGLRRNITMDTETYNFDLYSNYLAFDQIVNSTDGASEENAKLIAAQFLGTMGLYPKDIDSAKTKVELLSIKNGTLIPAARASRAQIVRINFYQKDIDEKPIVYPLYPRSNIDLLVAARAGDVTDIVEAHYFYQSISEKDPASYDLKTAEEAYKELQDGKGYVANYFGASKKITITEVYLAYFIGKTLQDYLMPVIVFQGNGDFYAYVSAVKEDFIDTAKTATTPTPTVPKGGLFPTLAQPTATIPTAVGTSSGGFTTFPN